MSSVPPSSSPLLAGQPGPIDSHAVRRREYHGKITLHLLVGTVLFAISLLSRFLWSALPWTPLALSAVCLCRGYYEALRWRASTIGIVCYSHSPILYQWPLWLYAFAAADITLWFGSPLRLPSGETIHVMSSSSLGVGFAFLLATLVFVTTVHLRGLWTLVFGFIILSTIGILHHFQLLGNFLTFSLSRPVFISREGFLAIGVLIFLPWLVTVFFFDLRRFVKIEPRMITMVMEMGGEKFVDTTGVSIRHLRDNYIQHRLLGFGSGDLVIKTSQSTHAIHIPNVFSVHYVITQIHRILELRSLP